MKFLKIILLFSAGLLASCSSLVLKPADFAWPIESVIRVGDDGTVKDSRYSLSFNAKGLFYEETEDSLAYLDRDLRIIRNTQGYYFITSDKFKNVYVFNAVEGELRLNEKIEISETGMDNPAFNQRPPYIQLISGDKKYNLTNEGIKDE